MFRAHVLTIRRSKLHYTVSGIIIPIGVMILEAVYMIQRHYTASSIITPIDVMILEAV